MDDGSSFQRPQAETDAFYHRISNARLSSLRIHRLETINRPLNREVAPAVIDYFIPFH